jgi:2-polyprenyl-3-methyl-5-hydroxy-6-metoxy-1,4-benzoquinol methylase
VNHPDRQAHWNNVYRTKGERDVSWFQESSDISLDLIRATGLPRDAAIIDVGGGASRLVDGLAAQDFSSITVLDLSEQALATSKARLGPKGQQVRWIVADVTTWRPSETYALWHDRAAFHFLTIATERAAYAECLHAAVAPRGHVIIGTFALDGPERCSGLPVVRHDAETIGQLLGPAFALVEQRRHDHATPGGGIQRFQFTRLQRTG